MAVQTRTHLKARFETGDRPTQQDFADLIDSFLNLTDDPVVTPVAVQDEIEAYTEPFSAPEKDKLADLDTALQHAANQDTYLAQGSPEQVSAPELKAHLNDTTSNPHSVTLEQARAVNPAFGGDVNMDGYKLTNLAAPTADTDAANKAYVDAVLPSVITTGDETDHDTTTTAAWENAFTYGGVPIPAGNYIMHWQLEITNTDAGQSAEYQINMSGVVAEGTMYAHVGGLYQTISGFKYVTDPVSPEVNYKVETSSTGTAHIRCIRIVFVKVS